MEKYRYTKEWEDKCRQEIWWKKSCEDCSFELLCNFQKNQERVLNSKYKDGRFIQQRWSMMSHA